MNMEEIIANSNNVYMFGSSVYGNKTNISDTDFIVVSDYYGDTAIHIDNNDFNIYSVKTFQEKLDNNDIQALECMFLDEKYIIKENIKFDFKIDYEKLKESVGKISSNSFVKCNKKLTVEKDYNPYIGKKSLWHSFRILMFGIQIVKYNKIIDYKEANYLFNKIMSMPDDWEEIKKEFKPKYNELKTKWRLELKEKVQNHTNYIKL